MLTLRKKQRRTLVEEASRAGGRVAAQARDMAGGAGEVARTAKTELHGLRKHARRRADRRMTDARHVAATRLQDTAAKLSSAAEAVENGHKKGRRWPRIALVMGAVAAAGLVVARRMRSTWDRDQTPGDSTHQGQPADADRPEAKGQLAETGGSSRAQKAPVGGVSREKVESGTSSGRNTRNDGVG